MLVQQPPRQNIDTLKSMISSEMLRYESVIKMDAPFKHAWRIRKNIKKLQTLLAKQEELPDRIAV